MGSYDMTRFGFVPSCLALAILALLSSASPAAVPTDAKERGEIIGQPTALTVQPAKIPLTGSRDRQQLVVTGKYADGTVRDLTGVVAITCTTPDLVAIADGYVAPRKNGTAT